MPHHKNFNPPEKTSGRPSSEIILNMIYSSYASEKLQRCSHIEKYEQPLLSIVFLFLRREGRGKGGAGKLFS